MSIALVAMLGAAARAHAADEIHWTLMGQSAVSFDWRGPESSIRYGLTPAYGQSAIAVTPTPLPWSSPGPFWEARLKNLVPDTLYHYSIGTGPDHTFRTARSAMTSSFTVYAEGDVGSTTPYPRMGTVQSLIAQGRPDFTLMLGDLTYANAHGPAVVDEHFNDVMVWSQDAAYMPAWGNHEYESGTYVDDLRNYKGRLDLPNAHTSPGVAPTSAGGEDWYWFDYGNVRFIAYPEPTAGAWADWYPHADSLMDAAQADPNITFIVTFGHRPAYSTGHHPGAPTLKGYLDQLGATHGKYKLNLNGHSHNYERSFPQSGVVHITAGGGGGNLEEDPSGSCLYRGGCPAPEWSAFRAYRHGTVRLVFAPDRIRIEAICGPSVDSGSNQSDIACTVASVFDSVTILSASPEARIDTPPTDVTVAYGDAVHFSGTGVDPDADGPLHYVWNFDGGAPNAYVEDPGPIQFVKTGVFHVTFTVIDSSGEADPTPDVRVVTVGAVNRAPNGDIVSPSGNISVIQGNSVMFQGVASDPDGDTGLSYLWDFDEGAPNANVLNPGAVRFDQLGQYIVRFFVTDSHGLADPTPGEVEIIVAPPNQAPEGSIVTPPAGVTIMPGESVSFAASGSDPDGDLPLSYAWNFGGGAPNAIVQNPGPVTFASPGVYTVTLTVTDARGLADPTPRQTTVTVTTQPNILPLAALDLQPATGNSPLSTVADATGSIDSDGSIVSYVFDFGDGTVIGPVTTPVCPHVYSGGAYTAHVTVKDNRGGTQTTQQSVIVAPTLPGTNLVGNASAETGLTGWAAYGGGSMQRVPGGFEGASSFQVIGPPTTATFGLNDSPNWVAVTPAENVGVAYRFTAWVRSPSSTGRARIQVREFLGLTKIGTTAFSPFVPLRSGWNMVTIEYSVVRAGTTLDFMVFDYPAAPSETLLVDNVSIKVRGSTTGVGPLDGVGEFAAVLSPNPLHAGGAITFTMPRPGFARVELLDLSGRRVRTLLDAGELSAGTQRVWFDGRGLDGGRIASGVYFYRVATVSGTITRRFAVLK